MTKDYKSVSAKESKSSRSGSLFNGLFTFILGIFVGGGLGLWFSWQNQTHVHQELVKAVPEYKEPTKKQSKADKPLISKTPKPVEQPHEEVITEEEVNTLTAQIEEPTFDFYNLLPEMEVQLPKNTVELPVQEQTQSKERADTKYKYGLQVASFKNFYDAKKLSAQLAMIGLDAHLSTVKRGDNIWHRVRIAPFYNVRDMDKTQRILQEHNLNSMRYRIDD